MNRSEDGGVPTTYEAGRGPRRYLSRILVPLAMALAAAPPASADVGDERALAERYAPVVRLVAQEEECGYGEPYVPVDVDVLFGEPTVALRGPWGASDLIEIAPSSDDLSEGLYEHHLDFPGDALAPRCDYERWNDRLVRNSIPTIYAHVATDSGYPHMLALQYWFFYVFNDFNNKHEGDWEMIQLLFEAEDAAAALRTEPLEVGYSQHEGAERAAWGDDNLEIVDETHPVVHPASGSHANYFQEALFLGSSAAQGVGCDDTSEPTIELRPLVRTIPNDPGLARREFPWIAFEGRWGELQKAFYNGPTGPNLKRQWTEPAAWAEEEWRDRSYAIPGGGLLGTSATSFFCGAVGGGSDVLLHAVEDPLPLLLAIVALVALALYAIGRTTWGPAAPLRVMRRRAWGQVLAAATRMYVSRWTLFVGIGLAFVPIAALMVAEQALLVGLARLLGVERDGESGGVLALLVSVIGTFLALTGLSLVQAATARALVELDAGRSIGPLQAFRLVLLRVRPMLGALAAALAIVALLGASLALLPVAVWLVGRWALVAQVVELEGASSLGALRRSSELVRGHWAKVVSLVVVGATIALAAGPLVGALLIVLTDGPFSLLNLIAGLVYVIAMPLVALTTAYVYFDAIVRERLEAHEGRDVLPAEFA